MALRTRPTEFQAGGSRRRHRADQQRQPPRLLPDRLRGPAQQGHRRPQRVRARIGHPPGRRAQEPADLRDHDAAVGRPLGLAAVGRQALRPARPAGQAQGAGPRPRGRGARRRLPGGHRPGGREEGGHRRRPHRARRDSRRPAPAMPRPRSPRWPRGLERHLEPRRQLAGQRLAHRPRHSRERGVGRQRPGRRALRGGRLGGRAGHRLGPRPDRLRDPRRLRRRGRPGPGAGPGAPLDRSRGHRGDGHRPRPIDEHHRGLARGLSRRAREAPVARDRQPNSAEVGAGARARRDDLPGHRHPRRRHRARRSWPRPSAVLDAAGERFGFTIEWSEVLVGGVAIDAYGTAVRDEDLGRLRRRGRRAPGRGRRTEVGRPVRDRPPRAGAAALRKALGLFANLRPVVAEPALAAASPLRPDLVEGVDMLIVRELTGGLYFGERRETHDGPAGRQAYDTLLYTEPEVRAHRRASPSSWHAAAASS